MSPEERTKQLMDAYLKSGDDVTLDALVCSAIREAVADERERCAKIAAETFEDERLWENNKDGAAILGAAIRGRQ